MLLSVLAFSLQAAEQIAAQAHLDVPSSQTQAAHLLTEEQINRASVLGDTFSLAPLVQDSGAAIYVSAPSVTTHTFDGATESGGSNLKGTAGGTFRVVEGIDPLAGGVNRIIVEATAVSSVLQAEPWVSSAFAASGYVSWRLDVGSTAGGTNPIQPVTPFTPIASGINVFNSAGVPQGSFALSSNTSTATTLSGVAILGNSGQNIAGVNVASIQMYWDILPQPTDLALQLVDADDGAFLPGSPLDVYIKIDNLGAIASGASLLTLYASTDATITTADRALGSFAIPAIDAGDSFEATAPAALPANLANGTWYIGGILDASDPQAANNVKHDPNPISVRTTPEIRIRPLALTFNEPPKSPAAIVPEPGAVTSSQDMTRTVLPQLLNRARTIGRVRIIVGFDMPVQPDGLLTESGRQAQRQEIQARGKQVLADLKGFDFREHAQFRFIPYLALTVDADALQKLAQLPYVSSIEEDRLSLPALASSNSVIGSPLAWAEGYDGAGKTIAVLDTGVDKTHPWFTTGGNKVVSEACYSSTATDVLSLCPGGVESSTAAGSGINCTPSLADCEHGTHVAGIATGNDGTGPNFGVARGANLISIQVFSRFADPADCGGDPAPCIASFSSDQILALERVYELRNSFAVAAVNMSLGGGQFFNQASCDAGNAAIKAAIDALRSVNIPTVIAAGNNGWRDSILAPACVSSAISVGDTTDADAVAPASNVYALIHLLAPGSSITSAVPGGGTATFSGTSMAAPHVAGAWAVLKQINPAASVTQLLSTLQSTGTAVKDMRVGGVETSMPRINLDLAIGEPRTTFGIFNQGPGALNISSISPQTPAPWVTWTPQAPFTVQAGELKVVTVIVDSDSAPAGASQVRLLINSNDPDESPYPDGIFVNVTATTIFKNGFE